MLEFQKLWDDDELLESIAHVISCFDSEACVDYEATVAVFLASHPDYAAMLLEMLASCRRQLRGEFEIP